MSKVHKKNEIIVMKRYKFLMFLAIFFSSWALSQEAVMITPLSKVDPKRIKTDEFGQKYYYDEAKKAKIYEIDGETILVLDEIVLRKGPTFNNHLDRNYYYFINKRLVRVYPLFLTALEQYRDIEQELKSLDKKDQRAYARHKQNELAKEYETKLRDLTTTEGRVFAKLMNRATGKTVYQIIKELRGGWSAFWWNVKGNIAEVDIKVPYNPKADRTDQFLESLLHTHWNNGSLIPYEGASSFNANR